ncbi:MAG: hypothetical protein ACRD2L_11675, partial [Terriglobia bacterium]
AWDAARDDGWPGHGRRHGDEGRHAAAAPNDKGATITITSDDAKSARRIQKMAEMMRLMHELESEK